VIRLGTPIEREIEEKEVRVKDASHATRAVVEELAVRPSDCPPRAPDGARLGREAVQSG
jgi:hypothetical protein